MVHSYAQFKSFLVFIRCGISYAELFRTSLCPPHKASSCFVVPFAEHGSSRARSVEALRSRLGSACPMTSFRRKVDEGCLDHRNEATGASGPCRVWPMVR
eukprot:4981514-Amphidinium_carterae.1